MGRVRGFIGRVLLICAMATTWTCERKAPPTAAMGNAPPAAAENRAAPAAAENRAPPAGTVGPLGDDCYSTAGAVACPPDPTDPSGQNLSAHGGACSLHVCRPCGSAAKLAFRDEHGVASAGFCVCVPRSDDSGRGVFTCYSTKAWKEREGSK